jgi:hypothetical protein
MKEKDKGPVYPEWRKTTPVRVEPVTLRAAEQHIESCEACEPELAEVPFDYVLDCLTGCDPEVTDYVLADAAHCPRCGEEIRTGFWRWFATEKEGRKAFILPGTLVSLRRS